MNLRERFPNNQKINFPLLIHRTCPHITIFTLAIDRLNPGAVEDRGGDDGAQGAGGVPEDAAVLGGIKPQHSCPFDMIVL